MFKKRLLAGATPKYGYNTDKLKNPISPKRPFGEWGRSYPYDTHMINLI